MSASRIISSTSSSVNFSPRLVKMWRSSDALIMPLPSLSKMRKASRRFSDDSGANSYLETMASTSCSVSDRLPANKSKKCGRWRRLIQVWEWLHTYGAVNKNTHGMYLMIQSSVNKHTDIIYLLNSGTIKKHTDIIYLLIWGTVSKHTDVIYRSPELVNNTNSISHPR